MTIYDTSIRAIKYIYRFISKKEFLNPICESDRQKANDLIYSTLIQDKPCMISRFGTTELIAINNYICITSKKKCLTKIIDYITDKTHTPWWFKDHFHFMNIYSGIFPPTQFTAEIFAKRNLEDIPLIDILGSFQYYEKFMPLRKDIINVHLETLYPFFVSEPWTRALKGKKVLVVHPFAKTIKHQYDRRLLLFNNEDILPKFELITYKALQSAADEKVPFENWLVALKHMENEISKIDFDICILGCGAYGMPLAAHIKRIGKKAIHLGGGTQLLFGIKGKRWEDKNYSSDPNYPELFKIPYCNLFNEYWIKPLEEDTPKTAIKIDGACYW